MSGVDDALLADIRGRKQTIERAIEDAATGRIGPRRPVRLVAVSKQQPVERVLGVLATGHRVFGENRVQEAEKRWYPLREQYDPELHLIGPLQSNKAREAVALFDMIQSVDRPKIAGALAREMDRSGRRLPVLIQVNIGEEPQKAGIPIEEVDRFVASCRRDYQLDLQGLMCIPPVDQERAPYFALLRKLSERNGLPEISMGMSDDFPIAVGLGATMVRIGSALFGRRDYPPSG